MATKKIQINLNNELFKSPSKTRKTTSKKDLPVSVSAIQNTLNKRLNAKQRQQQQQQQQQPSTLGNKENNTDDEFKEALAFLSNRQQQHKLQTKTLKRPTVAASLLEAEEDDSLSNVCINQNDVDSDMSFNLNDNPADVPYGCLKGG